MRYNEVEIQTEFWITNRRALLNDLLASPKSIRRPRLHKVLRILALPAVGLFVLLLLTWAMVTQPILSPREAKNTPTVNPARLEAHVGKLVEEFFPRDQTHPENLDRAAAYIRTELGKAKGRTSDQPFAVEGIEYRNVIAMFGPKTKTNTKERIVVGAHYDAYGELPGADDNASGVAGLIELAYLLGNAQLPMQVELVAYTLEEPPYFRTPHMGSAFHAASLKKQGVPVRVMFSLETMGYFTDAPDSQSFPLSPLKLFYPSQGNFIAIVGKLTQGSTTRRIKEAMRNSSPLPVYSINAPTSVQGIDWSDHLSYWENGYTAVMITDTAFLRNRKYHTEGDTPDRLDYERMALAVQGVYGAVLALSQEPE